MGRIQSWSLIGGGGGTDVDAQVVEIPNTAQSDVNPPGGVDFAFGAAVLNTAPATYTPVAGGCTIGVAGLYHCQFFVPVYNNSIFGTYGDIRIQWLISGVTQANPRAEFHVPGGKDETPSLESLLNLTAGQTLDVRGTQGSAGGGYALITVVSEGRLILERIS